jgi:hypothetical protein
MLRYQWAPNWYDQSIPEHTQQLQVTTMKTREKEVSEHKAEIKEFETYMACKAWARLAIVSAVDDKWISKRHDEDISYQGVQPLELLELL